MTYVDEKRDFFLRYPHIKDFVQQTKSLLKRKYFPQGDISLSYDYDDQNDMECIWITITTYMGVSQTFSIMERFDAEWWLENLPRGEGHLHIDLITSTD